MNKKFEITPIGIVTKGRAVAIDDDWGQELATIELNDNFDESALFGLSEFSYVEIIFYFHLVGDEKIETGARHPRNNKDWPLVGIFAQRGKNRPNRIGLTSCKLVTVEGKTILVEGLDAIINTPIIDIKPMMKDFLPRGEIKEPKWASELMKEYWNKNG